MTYVGQQPATTFDSGIQDRFTGLTTNTVTLTYDISAEEDILVVWNNIVQDKNSYSVGGSGNKTVTLGGTLVSADVVTVYYLNKVMQSVNPTAGSVTSTTITDDIISGQTALGAEPADTDEFIVSDAGTLKRVDYSYIKGGGKILQVSHNAISDLGQATLNTGSWEAITTLTVSITPSATSSKIIVLASTHYDTGGASTDFGLNIYRDIASAGYNALGYLSSGPYLERNSQRVGVWNYTIVDSPSTTSACNYRFYGITGGTGYVDMKTANITLMEIDGS